MAAYSFSFSYSRWSVWKNCPAQYKYKHIDKEPEPVGPAMERGRKIHEDIANWIEGKTDDMPDSLKHFTQLGHTLRNLPAGQKKIESQLAYDEDWKPVSWFGKNAKARFIWDAGVIEPQEVHAVDWKTGKPYGSYDDQMQIFAIPAYLNYPHIEKFTGHLVYLDHEESIPYPISREQWFGPSGDPAMKDGLFGVWLGNIAMMKSDMAFLPKPSKEACRFCNFHQKKGGPCTVGYE